MDSGRHSSPKVEVMSSTPAVEDCVVLDLEMPSAPRRMTAMKQKRKSLAQPTAKKQDAQPAMKKRDAQPAAKKQDAQPTTKKRDAQPYINVDKDIFLLQEVVNIFPYSTPHLEKTKRWKKVMEIVNKKEKDKEQFFIVWRVKERLKNLLDTHKVVEMGSLRASSTA